VAYLNLENTYGTDESLEIVYKKALLVNDEKEIHLELIDIYVRSEKYEQAEVIYKSVLKKYKQSKKVWIKRCMYLFTRQKYQQVRKEFTLALECLPKKKQLALILKFAQLEFKHGEPERGRTIFENLISTYPKKLDYWSVYIDMEIGKNESDKVRNLFERVLTLNYSTKKK